MLSLDLQWVEEIMRILLHNLGTLRHSLTFYSNYCSNAIVEKFHNPEELRIQHAVFGRILSKKPPGSATVNKT